MLLDERISVDPQVCSGKPVIAGTRIPVKVILSALGAGESPSELLLGYPDLVMEDIQAAVEYAIDCVEQFQAIYA